VCVNGDGCRRKEEERYWAELLEKEEEEEEEAGDATDAGEGPPGANDVVLTGVI
jgi:hypothetical protein